MGKVSDAPDSRRNAPVRDIITPVRGKNIPVADKNISVSVNAFFVICRGQLTICRGHVTVIVQKLCTVGDLVGRPGSPFLMPGQLSIGQLFTLKIRVPLQQYKNKKNEKKMLFDQKLAVIMAKS